MAEPPQIGRKLRAVGRLTTEEMREINEHGLLVPSKKSENFEPELNDHALLWNAGTLAGTRPYNYRNNAKAKQKSAWNEYLEQRAEAEAKLKTRKNNGKNGKNGNRGNKGNKGNKSKNSNNNGTRRALF
jgi:hypothetical protein